MKESKKEIELINLKKFHRHLSVAQRQVEADKRFVLIAPTYAVRTDDFKRLPPWEQFELRVEATKRGSRKSIFCGFAAATILGVPHIKNDPRQTQVEMGFSGKSSPPAKNRWPKFRRYLYSELPTSQIYEVNDARVTSIERTFSDIRHLYGDRAALVFVESAMYVHQISVEKIRHDLVTRQPNTGRGEALRLLNQAYEGIQSPWETMARLELLEAKLPEVTSIVPQAYLPDPGPLFIPDLLVNGHLIIEIDGSSKYDVGYRQVMERERERERILFQRGYSILRFRPQDITGRMVFDVRQYLQRYNAHLHGTA